VKQHQILFEIRKIITGDEAWCLQYDPEANDEVHNQNSQHLQNPRKLACQNHK
jgi:hypothetical protein